MPHVISQADVKTMPKHNNPKELTINLKSDRQGDNVPSRPTSSPIAIEGVDLSSIEGGVGLNSLPPLPASPPSSPPGHRRDPSKNILGTWRPSKSRDRAPMDQQEQRSQVRQIKDDDDAYRQNSNSMSKIYHLRKNPGSTPELSLVGSAENVAKTSAEGTSCELSYYL